MPTASRELQLNDARAGRRPRGGPQRRAISPSTRCPITRSAPTPIEWQGYIYTDRPVYRPGHTVHFKAILRCARRAGMRFRRASRSRWRFRTPIRSRSIQKTLTVSANGTIHDDLVLPARRRAGQLLHRGQGRREPS